MNHREAVKALRQDFPRYAKHNLVIRAKDGHSARFDLNKAQQHIHECLEEQRRETGKVRAIILKGRQQGCSTYVEGRFYWLTSLNKGKRAFILTHEEDASKNIFEMAQRYHEHSRLKPETGTTNAKELLFSKLDSGYKVGTAGNKAVGRSNTFQFFHGSEVAYWPHASEHAKGVLQAVPDQDDTEVILESTANGIGNYFHQQWKLAETGMSEYIPIFVPWFWQDEYRKPVAADFSLTEEEEALAVRYDWDLEQINWRRNKIVELSAGGVDGESAFKQEYPNNANEAFQTTGMDGLISPDDCLRARDNQVSASGALVVGVDPSRGGDRFAVIKRCGRKAYDLNTYIDKQVDKLGKAVAICKKVLDEVDPVSGRKPDKMFVDSGGGADLVDRLHELSTPENRYDERVRAIAFGSTPLDIDRYRNKRAEMWGLMADWMKDENLPVEIPDEDELQGDLCACPYERDSHDRILLWRKEKIVKELGFSPDSGDALALTFAQPVKINQNVNNDDHYYGGGSWMS